MTDDDTLAIENPAAAYVGERCRDYDEDCEGVRCKLTCWMYDPGEGYCPFLVSQP